jgi:hypothetical protein
MRIFEKFGWDHPEDAAIVSGAATADNLACNRKAPCSDDFK